MVKLITYYPTGQRHIVEERVNGKRKSKVSIYDTSSVLIQNIYYSTSNVCSAVAYCYDVNDYDDDYYDDDYDECNHYDAAYVNWYSNGSVAYIKYRQYKLYLETQKSGDIQWYENGNLETVYCYYNNKLHNSNGPAWINWDKNNNVKILEYYLHGKMIKSSLFPVIKIVKRLIR